MKCFLQFMSKVADTRKASEWLEANKGLLRSEVQMPSLLTATDEEIKGFAQQQLDSVQKLGAGVDKFKELQVELLINFNNEGDWRTFNQKVVRDLGLKVNSSLFGSDYVNENVIFNN